jgi:hypothetical protein
VSFTLKTMQRTLQERIATNATQSRRKAQYSRTQTNGQPLIIHLLK